MSVRTCWLPDCTTTVFSTEMPVFCSEACRTLWRELHQVVIDASPMPARIQTVVAPRPVVETAGCEPTLVVVDEVRSIERLAELGAPIVITPGREGVRVEIDAEATRIALACIRGWFDEVTRQWAVVVDQIRRAFGAPPPTPPKSDPAARALFLRKNRNTGPAKPQRAPRHLGPRQTPGRRW